MDFGDLVAMWWLANDEVYKTTKFVRKDDQAYYETLFTGIEYLAEIKIAASEL